MDGFKRIAESRSQNAAFRCWLAAYGISTGILALAAILIATKTVSDAAWPVEIRRTEMLLAFSGAGVTLLSLSRRLPLQNVLLAAATAGAAGSFLEIIYDLATLPAGSGWDGGGARAAITGMWRWPIPWIWMIAILNARGVAQLILRPWRQTYSYGFRLVALTSALAVLIQLGWDLFAAAPTFQWNETAAFHSLTRLAAAPIILAVITPSLINKKPVAFPPDCLPSVPWVLFNLLFVFVAARRGVWPAAAFSAATLAIPLLLALWGRRTNPSA